MKEEGLEEAKPGQRKRTLQKAAPASISQPLNSACNPASDAEPHGACRIVPTSEEPSCQLLIPGRVTTLSQPAVGAHV